MSITLVRGSEHVGGGGPSSYCSHHHSSVMLIVLSHVSLWLDTSTSLILAPLLLHVELLDPLPLLLIQSCLRCYSVLW